MTITIMMAVTDWKRNQTQSHIKRRRDYRLPCLQPHVLATIVPI